jgi:hypothetical protein
MQDMLKFAIRFILPVSKPSKALPTPMLWFEPRLDAAVYQDVPLTLFVPFVPSMRPSSSA